MHDRKDPWERFYERFNEKGLETTNEDDFMRKNYIRKIYEKQMKNIFKNSWVRKDVETTPQNCIYKRPFKNDSWTTHELGFINDSWVRIYK